MRRSRQVCLILTLEALFLISAANAAERDTADLDNLSEQVEHLYEQGLYTDAIVLAERAVQLGGRVLNPDHPDLARPLHNLALLYRTTEDYARAEPLFERALAIRENSLGPEHPAVAQSLHDLAELHRATGDTDRATRLLTRSLAIREKTLGPEHPDVARSLHNLALIYITTGDLAHAEPLFERSLTIFEKSLGPEHPSVAVALHNFSSLYQANGDYARAEPLIERARSIQEKSLAADHPAFALTLASLGNLYRATGDYARARPLIERSLSILERSLGAEHSSVAWVLECSALLDDATGDHARAERLFKRALNIQTKALGRHHPLVGRARKQLGLHYTKTGDYARARPLYLRALAIDKKAFGPDHQEVGSTLLNLGSLYRVTGDHARAQPHLERALSIFEKTLGREHPVVGSTLMQLALLSWAVNDLGGVTARFGRAIQIEEQQIDSLLTLLTEERSRNYLATLRSRQNLLVSFQATHPTQTTPRRLALETVLRRKGRLLDASAQSIDALRRSLDASERASLETLVARRSEFARVMVRGAGEDSIEQHYAIVTQLQAALHEAEEKAARRGGALRRAVVSVTLADVQAGLESDAALLEFVVYNSFEPNAARGYRWGAARYGAFLLRSNGDPVWVDLGEATVLAQQTAAFRNALQRPTAGNLSGGLDKAARALHDALISPLAPHLEGVKSLFVAPEGALNLVPLSALRSGEGNTARYLAEQYTITYLTSGRDLVRFVPETPQRSKPVIVAAPDFGSKSETDSPATELQRSRELRDQQWQPLPGTRVEGEAVGKILGVKPFLGADARESRIKQVQRPNILHIATHGFFLDDQPSPQPDATRSLGLSFGTGERAAFAAATGENPLLRSGLVLAGANELADGEDDGILTALEAMGLDLTGTELVMLSACDTGVGTVANGEGVYGLRRAMVIAGAQSQVTTLWKINDDATRGFVERYYKRLLDGEGRSEALRQVQLEMLKSPVLRHPYYWAAFIPIGATGPLSLDSVVDGATPRPTVH